MSTGGSASAVVVAAVPPVPSLLHTTASTSSSPPSAYAQNSSPPRINTTTSPTATRSPLLHRPGGRLPSALHPAASTPLLKLDATALARKASLQALTGGNPTSTPPHSSSYRGSGIYSNHSNTGGGGGSQPSMGPAKVAGADGREIELGDTVDVPGGMWGTVKFLGAVKGKNGVFAGVELHREFAGRGKNDGDVEGIRYFTTSVSGSGIFLPTKRASKRASMTNSMDSFPPTPRTPGFPDFAASVRDDKSHGLTPPTPALPKFSQSVGPGARAPSPVFKPKSRPSLPRPESPFRSKPHLAPTPARQGNAATPQPSHTRAPGLSGTPRLAAASPLPGKPNFSKSRGPASLARTNSNFSSSTRDGPDDASVISPAEVTPTAPAASRAAAAASQQSNDEDMQRLRTQLAERDRQLREQASSLADMEASLAELSTLLPTGASSPSRKRPSLISRDTSTSIDDADAPQLRALIREKNERISVLTAEFDAHRADFRSTIDTLELASTETERVYEKRIEDLTAELKELQEGRDDVESVARQLKQLEELVQELEEGLEDARRGEAEARGEVEFLRGEVERGRSELRREREKAAAALKGAGAAVNDTTNSNNNNPASPLLSPGGSTREVEQRDDEIRGLKAIIHSLSSGPDMGTSPRTSMRNGLSVTSPGATHPDEVNKLQSTVAQLEREKSELQGMVDRKSYREEELERELETIRRHSSTMTAAQQSRTSTQTAIADPKPGAVASPGRGDVKGNVLSWRDQTSHHRHQHSQGQDEYGSENGTNTNTEATDLWCDYCETEGHDILSCRLMSTSGSAAGGAPATGAGRHTANNSNASNHISSAERERERSNYDDEKTPTRPTFAMRSRHEAGSSTSSHNPPDVPLPAPLMAKARPRNPTAAVLEHESSSRSQSHAPESAVDEDEWCALCERDGHNATNCPEPSF